MAKVSGYLLDQATMEYITTGGRVLITGDAELETALLDTSAFIFDDVPPGSYVVSILDVDGYSPTNKFLDIEEGEDEVDLGWFAAKAIPKSVWGTHNDYE